jgi:hypothetical protein
MRHTTRHTATALAVLLLALGAPAAKAGAPLDETGWPSPPSAVLGKRHREFIGVNIGAQFFDFGGENTKSALLYGAAISGGGYLSKDRPFLKNLLLTAEAGVFFGDFNDTLLDTLGVYQPPGSTPVPGLEERYSLRRKSEQMNIPALLTLAYEFRPLDNLGIRFGPSLGVTFVSMKSDFEARVDVSDGTSNGTVWSDKVRKSGSELLFSYGATLGATWDVTEHFSLDAQYRFSRNTDLDFGVYRDYGASSTHQFTLGAKWRF